MSSKDEFILSPEIQQLISYYYWNPVEFVKDIIGASPDVWQEIALYDMAFNQRVAIKAGHSVGKSAMESWVLWWFIFTRPNCRIIATAPTKTHMFDVLWAEAGHWLGKSEILQKYFEWQKTRIVYRENPSNWFAVAKTASKSEGMAGTHKEDSGVLIIIDEGSGVDSDIIEALEGSITDDNCKMLICGNPVKTTGYFKDCFTTDKRFEGHRHTVSCINSKIVTRNVNDRIKYAQGIAEKYGIDSNVYRIRVLGLFPKVEDDVFIPIDLYTNALLKRDFYAEGDKVIEKRIIIPNGDIQIGVDVARYGGDSTVYNPRVGQIMLPQIKRPKPSDDIGLMQFAQELYIMAANLMKTYKQNKALIAVDDNGVGGGLVDRLKQMLIENPIEGCDVEIAACNSWNTVNKELEKKKKSENKAYIPYSKWGDQMYGHLKDLLMTGELFFYEYSEQLEGELTCRKYSMPNGLIKLETKDQMKDRGLKSPDHSDAAMLAVAPIHIQKSSSYIENDESDPEYAKYIEQLKKEGLY